MHKLLDAYLMAAAAKPFNWRLNNCAHFAASWVDLVYGVTQEGSVLSAWLGGMSDLRGSMRRLRAVGGHLEAADAALGAHVPGVYAARGDVVLLALPKQTKHFGYVWGIATGSHAAALGRESVLFMPMSMVVAAWRVL